MSRQSRDVPLCINGVEVTATAAELNALDGYTGSTTELNLIAGYTGSAASLNALDAYSGTTADLSKMSGIKLQTMTPGTGISAVTNAICVSGVSEIGGLTRTEILVDLTDLVCPDTIDDIIGGTGGAANSHIGQITTALNGVVHAATLYGHELPAGGDPDIEIWTAGDGTLAQGVLITDESDEVQLVVPGDMSATSVDNFSAWPAADQYLYMVAGTVTAAAYTAGRFVLVLWGI